MLVSCTNLSRSACLSRLFAEGAIKEGGVGDIGRGLIIGGGLIIEGLVIERLIIGRGLIIEGPEGKGIVEIFGSGEIGGSEEYVRICN